MPLTGPDPNTPTSIPVPITEGGTGEITAAAAFAAIKQTATIAATGVVELATTAEVTAGTAGKVITADGLAASTPTFNGSALTNLPAGGSTLTIPVIDAQWSGILMPGGLAGSQLDTSPGSPIDLKTSWTWINDGNKGNLTTAEITAGALTLVHDASTTDDWSGAAQTAPIPRVAVTRPLNGAPIMVRWHQRAPLISGALANTEFVGVTIADGTTPSGAFIRCIIYKSGAGAYKAHVWDKTIGSTDEIALTEAQAETTGVWFCVVVQDSGWSVAWDIGAAGAFPGLAALTNRFNTRWTQYAVGSGTSSTLLVGPVNMSSAGTPTAQSLVISSMEIGQPLDIAIS